MYLTAVPTAPIAVIANQADARAADDEPDLAERAGQAIAALSPLRAQVAALSLFADGPPAHEETAAVLGLTRGRVGQLVEAARDDLIADLDSGGLLTMITGHIRKRIGIALPRSELLNSFPLLTREIPAAGQPGVC